MQLHATVQLVGGLARMRHEGRELVFNTEKITTYGELSKQVSINGRILSESFLEILSGGRSV